MQSLKEYWQKISDKTKKMIIAIVTGTAAIAIVSIVALNLLGQKDYSTLFTGLNQEEAQEVVALLQEEGIDYRYNDRDGAIRVPAGMADQTRAGLLSKGYPKSGFSYDIYRNNAGLMTTESDKKQYTLYELQNRLGAQICLFDGVRDAKVTIAEAGEQTYAKGDMTQTDASASVVVTMQNGQSLSENTAAAIKKLIATAVRGMNFTSVSVFDAVTMVEVGGSGSDSDGGIASAKDLASLTSLIENNIAGNIRRVLEMLYGQGNVAVSVKGSLNMEKLIQENTIYSTPDKIDEQDKEGLLQRESVTNENSAMADQGAGGVVGADANADTPRYTNDDGTQAIADSYANSSATREWLYNTVKEQRQVDPGVLENATVAIVINTEDTTTVTAGDLTRLVANAAGISQDVANQNISIIRAPLTEPGGEALPVDNQDPEENTGLPLPIIIAMAAGGILILLLLVLLLLGRRKRKKQQQAEEYSIAPEAFAVAGSEDGGTDGFAEAGSPGNAELRQAAQLEDEEMAKNEEIINLRMQHSLKLKQNIGEFVDQNPQIAAKLVQSWLRGEGELNGGKRSGGDSGNRSKTK